MLRRSVETTPRKRTQPSAKNLAAKNLLRISKGTCHPPPQKTKERNLPGDTKWVLEAARSALVAELGSGARDRMPAKAARAQAMFDCWMQEQEENNQPKDIARCRSAFDRALKDIGKVQVASAPPAPVPGPYTIFFAFDSAKLDAKAMAVIKKAAGEAQAANISGIILNAHTDRAGTNKYNEQLSRARLDVVGNALSAAGVSLDSSIRSSLGEDFPFVSTPDGKRGAKNRRSDFGFLTLAVIWRVVAKRRLYPQKRKSRRWFLKQPKDFIHLSPL